jgi:hypothetical protein
MPLEQSKTKEAFGRNLSELMRTFKRKGSIGSSGKLTKEEARKRALAIAFKIKGGS